MQLTPTSREKVARARADLRLGLPVLVSSEAATLIFIAAEGAVPSRLTALRAGTEAPLSMAISAWRAQTLKARVYDGDVARILVPRDLGEAELSQWVGSVADPALDLRHPMKGPLQSLRDGDASLFRMALFLTKSAQLLPCVVGVEVARSAPMARTEELTELTPSMIEEDLARADSFYPVAAAQLPIALAGTGRLHVVRPDNGGIEHYVFEVGRPDRDKPVLTRLHSACFTGDVLGSLKCDCGPQLHAALAAMHQAGSGMLLYLNQEGRGIGLANKMRAYALQDQGFDTVEANHRLGFEDDERDFRIGAEILEKLGVGAVRLMTNNPRKVEMLEREGLEVTERVPLVVGENPLNRAYLDAKRSKSGHLF